MTFIRTIEPADAEGVVREMYERVERQQGFVPNWTYAFSLRPRVQETWTALISSIRSTMSVRAYELATLAAARSLRSTYCSMAHGTVLANQVFDASGVTAIGAARNIATPSGLTTRPGHEIEVEGCPVAGFRWPVRAAVRDSGEWEAASSAEGSHGCPCGSGSPRAIAR